MLVSLLLRIELRILRLAIFEVSDAYSFDFVVDGRGRPSLHGPE
jgi:hypothetical protein